VSRTAPNGAAGRAGSDLYRCVGPPPRPDGGRAAATGRRRSAPTPAWSTDTPDGNRSWIDQLHLSHAATHDEALDNAWNGPNGAVPPLLAEIAVTSSSRRSEAMPLDEIEQTVARTTDVGPIAQANGTSVAGGLDTVHLHHAGPNQQRLADVGTDHSTFGTGHDGGRRAIPTIDVTRSSAARAGSTLDPTSPVAP
jgi:hypothetical protein